MTSRKNGCEGFGDTPDSTALAGNGRVRSGTLEPGRSPDVSRIVSAAVTWPGIHAKPLQYDGTDFLLGHREIGHVHGDRLVDIPFPKTIRDELIAAGRAQPHHVLRSSGWVSVTLRGEADVERALELLRFSYDLAVKN